MSARLNAQLNFLQKLNGSPQLLGTLVSTGTSVNNSSTATPFTIAAGAVVLLQPTAAGYIRTGKTTALAAASTTSVKLAADEKYLLLLQSDEAYVAWIPGSGSANCLVHEMK